MADELKSWTLDGNIDLVHSEFEKLISSCKYIRTTENAIIRANRRKLLGHPPTSPDKHTIGDELIWESLLESVEGDLIVVSRDKAFRENQAVLKREFDEFGVRSLVLVTSVLSEALERAGQPSQDVKAAEESIQFEKRRGRSFPRKCLKCGGELEETGYEGNDGDSAWWLFCVRCGEEFFPDAN